jgi:hypothetical protein
MRGRLVLDQINFTFITREEYARASFTNLDGFYIHQRRTLGTNQKRDCV